MRRGLIIAGGVLLAAVIVFFATRSDRLIAIASGATSETLCSKTFLAGLDPDEVYAQDMLPEGGMGLLDWALRYTVDREHKEVRTTVFGLFATRSIYRDGLGCVLVHDVAPADGPEPAATTAEQPSLVPEIAGAEIVTPTNPAIAAAIVRAFEEPANGPPRWTQAVVVVHEGKVIGERYAPGFGIDTPLLSHSIAKSVINALTGILARQGKLIPASPVPAPSWHGEEGDPRAETTIDELLRMSTGLPVDEGNGSRLAQYMFFLQPDSAAFAESAPFAASPGTAWAYSNLGYQLASRAVRDEIGGGPRGVAAFARRELFLPLGMRHAVIEFDSAGTPMGASAMFATAREWAQFGLLYLNDGVAGSQRILPEGWVKYSTTPTLGGGYGAGFWLNTSDAEMPVWRAHWGLPGAPRDAYFARGYLGQYIVIVPSEKLVVARFGASHVPGGDIAGAGALVHDVVAALKASSAAP